MLSNFKHTDVMQIRVTFRRVSMFSVHHIWAKSVINIVKRCHAFKINGSSRIPYHICTQDPYKPGNGCIFQCDCTQDYPTKTCCTICSETCIAWRGHSEESKLIWCLSLVAYWSMDSYNNIVIINIVINTNWRHNSNVIVIDVSFTRVCCVTLHSGTAIAYFF